jgi:hypothetical protein
LEEKEFRTILRLVLENARVQLPGNVINADKQVLPCQGLVFACDQGETLTVKVHKLTRVGLIVAPCFPLALLLQVALNLGKTF